MKRNRMLKLLCMMIALFTALPSMRAASVYIPDFEIDPGGSQTVSVSVNPGQEPMFLYQGLQFDLTLPEGITLATEQTSVLAPLSGFDVRTESYGNGRYRVVTFTNGDAVSYTSELLALTFEAAGDLDEGKLSLNTSRVIFSDPMGLDVNADGSTTTITVNKPDYSNVNIYIPDFTITAGESFGAQVNIEHGILKLFEYQGFQFDLYLPEYLSIDLTQCYVNDILNGFKLTADNYGSGHYRFVVFTNGDAVSYDTNLLTITFTATPDAPEGEVIFNNNRQIFSDAMGLDITTGTSTTTVTIEAQEINIEITLDPDHLDMEVGDEEQITATVTPESESGRKIVWTSSDPNVATVDENGNVTATGEGDCTITATIYDEEGNVLAQAEATVTVTAPVMPEGSIYIPDFSIERGSTQTVPASVLHGEDPMFEYSGYQFNVAVPEHITITGVTSTVSGISVRFEPFGTNAYRILGVGTATFTADQLVNITYAADDQAAAGEYTLPITTVRFSTPTGLDIYLDDSDYTITVTVPEVNIEITLDPDHLDMEVGDEEQITATVTPESESGRKIVWTSSDPNVATVDENGNVTATGEGDCTITATIYDEEGNVLAQAEATVTVTAPAMPEGSIYIPDFSIERGSTQTVPASVLHGEDPMFEYSGYQFNVAVPEHITITGVTSTVSGISVRFEPFGTNAYRILGVGTATFTADQLVNITYAADDQAAAGTYTLPITTVRFSTPTGLDIYLDDSDYTITVTVPEVKIELTLDPTSLNMIVGDEATIKATITPESEKDRTIVWTSSDPNVAEVDQDGNVTAKSQGSCTITATIYDEEGNVLAQATCTVTVNTIPPDSITLNVSAEGVTIYVGETFQLIATVLPENTTDKTVTWTSNDPTIATVSTDGLVTGVAPGVITVTATCQNVSATAKVTVIEKTQYLIELDKYTMQLTEGESGEITATVRPELPEGWYVVWSSDDTQTATVDQNGNVTGESAGTANITATLYDEDGNPVLDKDGNPVSATCEVTVNPKKVVEELLPTPGEGTVEGDPDKTPGENTADGAALIGNDLTIRVGQTADINIVTVPELDYDPELRWLLGAGGGTYVKMTQNDDNSLIATFTGREIGTTVYTVYAATNPSATATGTIRVIAANPALALEVTPKEVTLAINAAPYALTATITPEDATVQELSWTSSDENVATVDQNGVVTPVALGQTTVTATTIDGTNLSDYSIVTVVPRTEIESLNPTPGEGTEEGDPTLTPGENTANGAALIGNDLIIRVGQTADINIVTVPEINYEPGLVWELGAEGDKYVTMTVNEENTLTATFTGLAIGTTTYTAYVGDNTAVRTTGNIKVIAANPALALEVNPKEVTLHESDAPYQLIATITPADASVQELIWTSTNEAVATVDGNGLVTPVAIGETTITAYTTDGTDLSDSSLVLVIEDVVTPPEPETPWIPEGDGPADWYGNVNGTWVSEIKIREGNTLAMTVNEPVGGYGNWEYLWTAPDNEEIGDERLIETSAELYGAAANAGNNQAISDNVYNVTVSDYDMSGNIWWEKTLGTATVHVYKRPQIPTQLLRKGQSATGGIDTPETGTSHTFVVMMTPLDNQQILDLGYRYVYGYTDANGNMTELDDTELRYTHTTDEIYWNDSYTFWAYSYWVYPDGAVITSGLRYLDGSEDPDFDGSSFEGGRNIQTRWTGVTGVYTLDGRYMGTATDRLEPGIYIIRTEETATKIIVK